MTSPSAIVDHERGELTGTKGGKETESSGKSSLLSLVLSLSLPVFSWLSSLERERRTRIVLRL
jgi:hypothetical protein